MRVFRHVYVQVLVGIALGVMLGYASPAFAVQMKVFADLFVKLVKMCVAPLVFLAIVHGIGSASGLKEAGRVGLKALFYFEVVSTLAMLCGWLAGEVIRPGAGMNVNPHDLDPRAISTLTSAAASASGDGAAMVLSLVPGSLFEPLVKGDMMQILFVAILTGCVLLMLGERARAVRTLFDQGAQVVFAIMRVITAFAPLAAFGAIGFTVGKFGLAALKPLLLLVVSYYAALALFVIAVLWLVLRWCGIGLGPVLRYIQEEIFIVFGTIASESVMPRLIVKMEALGCKPSVVRLVMPTAYSFNLDGTALYLVLAPLFIAQATNIDLSWGDKLGLFALLMVMSKGAAGVTAGVLVTLVSVMTADPIVPAAGIAITLGVDRLMNEGRAVLNVIGNVVATLVICRWEGALDRPRLEDILVARKGVMPVEARQD